ncbi:hypothetical protein UPYG_G00055610 [Umbra pygmaea]|uniref:C2H2-type domain-containing protein n=1 Tax=Umbra pygmaea TaxID=75934 RepID=A0ABD0XVL5_UMBPY
MPGKRETLLEEIEKNLHHLTEDNLVYLCERCGIDVSKVKGKNRRSLRRKIMEEMWENADSEKSEEQGISWLLRLKNNIRKTLDESGVVPGIPSQSDEEGDDGHVTTDCEEWDVEDEDWFPSNGLEAESSDKNGDEDSDSVSSKSNGDASNSPSLRGRGLSSSKSPVLKGILRAHSCGVCQKTFMKSGDLKRHQRIHTGNLKGLDFMLTASQNNMGEAREALMEEIEESLHPMTRNNLRYLCERCGVDVSEVDGKNRRFLRRKIMEEMWENADSDQSEEQGMSWLLRLKEDIDKIHNVSVVAPVIPSPSEDDDDEEDTVCKEERHVEDKDWFPSNGLRAKSSPRRDEEEHSLLMSSRDSSDGFSLSGRGLSTDKSIEKTGIQQLYSCDLAFPQGIWSCKVSALLMLPHKQDNMTGERETLMEEIEKSLHRLTEEHLLYLCSHCGIDGSMVIGKTHRSLRRKIMEVMWQNEDSGKSEEQVISWLLRLKGDIEKILDESIVAPMTPSQSDDDDKGSKNNEDRLNSHLLRDGGLFYHSKKIYTSNSKCNNKVNLKFLAVMLSCQ